MSDPAADVPSSSSEAPDPATPVRQLLAWLLEDQRRCWRHGDPVLVEAYLDRYPALRADAEAVLDLLYNEFVLREEHGPAPRPEDYFERFPDLAPVFRTQLQFHQAFPLQGLSGATPAPGAATVKLTGPPAGGATGHEPSVPGYEILGELGRGGMGVVYKAWQLRLDRVVALKMILSGPYAGPHEFARFRTEAQSAARLQHPNIVQIHEVGEHDGRSYLTLEFVDGGSLAQRLGGRPLSAGPAAQLVRDLARAMHYAHGRGVVHRDLKPANVLLTADGTPKITDFGLARCLGAAPVQTQTGALLGTPSYMAPEQAGGHARQVGPGADVYSLGAILYELLTGRPPFLAETALDTLEQARAQEPVPPARLQPKVPRDLETICLKCLRKGPDQRYPSAGELAEDLELFLSDRPIRARRTGRPARAWRWSRRNPAVAGLMLAVVVTLLAGTVVSGYFAVQANERAAAHERAERKAKERLHAARLAQAQAGHWSGRPGRRFDGLFALAEAAQIARELHMPEDRFLELRNEAIALMTLTDLRKTQELAIAAPGDLAMDAVFNARLERQASSDEQGNVSIRGVPENDLLKTLRGPGSRAWVLRFSPDGRFLAAKYHPPGLERPNRFQVWDVNLGTVVLTAPFGLSDRACAFSPDSRWLAVGGDDDRVRLYDLTGNERVRDLGEVRGPACLAFDPAARKLAIAAGDTGEVQVRDVGSGEVLRKLPHPRRSNSLAWHPDGTRLAVACADFQIYLWDAVAGGEPLILRGHEAEALDVVFSHGGNLLVSTSWELTRLWDPWTGKQLLSVSGAKGSPQFSPDDQVLGFAGGGLDLWEVAADRELRTLRGHTGYKGPWCVSYSPDGRLLVSAGPDGVRVWDAARAREVAVLPGKNPRSALVDPTGRQLLVCHGTGLDRWPIAPDPEGAGDRLRIGPVQSLAGQEPGLENRAALAADGRTLAFNDYAKGQALVLDLETLTREVLPGGLPGIARIAISPDGRWVAGFSDVFQGVRVWDRRTGTVARGWPIRRASVAFSRDGNWFVTGTPEGYTFWAVGSWERGREVRPGSSPSNPAVFSPDDKVLALSTGRSVRLVAAATGAEVATLTAPNPGTISWMCFSPDGGQLAVATEAHAIQLWDLRLIRRQLATMDLDWDLPALSDAPPSTGATPVSITVLDKDESARP